MCIKNFSFLLLIFLFTGVYGTCTRDVIWQSNFCPLNMSLNGAILPPDNATCRFQAGDTLSLINSDANRTENIYQVRTREDWENCNATNAFNSMPRLVNDSNTVQLVTGNFFTFNVGQIIYLISTSNGSEDSANNDIIGTSPCLRMSFLLVPPTSECTLLPACNDSVLSKNVLNFGCNADSIITTTEISPSTSVNPKGSTTTTTKSSTISSVVMTDNTTFLRNKIGSNCLSSKSGDFCLDFVLFPLLVLLIIAVAIAMLILFPLIYCVVKPPTSKLKSQHIQLEDISKVSSTTIPNTEEITVQDESNIPNVCFPMDVVSNKPVDSRTGFSPIKERDSKFITYI